MFALLHLDFYEVPTVFHQLRSHVNKRINGAIPYTANVKYGCFIKIQYPFAVYFSPS